MNPNEIKLLIDLLSTNTPSGNEGQIISIIKKEMRGVCKLETDCLGNLYMYTGGHKGATVMLTAHCDEVGFQITDIDNDGFAYIRRLGGLDRQTIPGTKVVALTKKGDIVGVFGKKSPHVQNDEEKKKVIEIEDMWIDFGFSSKDEAQKVITIGDYVTAYEKPHLSYDNHSIVSKALDNKISVFILLEVVKKLSNSDVNIPVVCVATTQEEIGCRGGIVASHRISPDIAMCLDVGIATDIPGMSKKTYGNFKLGDGPGICRTPENNEKFVELLKETAKFNNIKYQFITGFRPVGGTETGRIQLSSNGVVTAHISIPNRYMHSVVEMCNLDDIENAINLITKTIHTLQDHQLTDFNPY